MNKIIIVLSLSIIGSVAMSQIKPAGITTSKIKSSWNLRLASGDKSAVEHITLAELKSLDVEANAGRLLYCSDCKSAGLVFVGPNGIERASIRCEEVK